MVRHRLLAELVKLWKNGKLTSEDIDRLPLKLSPKHSKHAGRCCVHKERAVWKYKSLPLLGLNMEDETDELTPLSEYAKKDELPSLVGLATEQFVQDKINEIPTPDVSDQIEEHNEDEEACIAKAFLKISGHHSRKHHAHGHEGCAERVMGGLEFALGVVDKIKHVSFESEAVTELVERHA